MSGRWSYSLSATSSAPIETVFDVLADARRWKEWTFVQRSDVERQGDPPPFGVGTIRRLGTGPGGSREEVVVYEPPRRYSYTMLSGLPVRSYRADVELTSRADGGTDISWSGGFERPVIPGTGGLFLWMMRRMVKGFANGLSRRAEQVASGPS